MTVKPKKGPIAAPKISEMADMITQGIAAPGSTHALWASFIGLGTFEGTFQIFRSTATVNPPTAINGIHHQLPAHQPVPTLPKKKLIPAPVTVENARDNTPPAAPITSVSKRSFLYHGFSRGSISVTFQPIRQIGLYPKNWTFNHVYILAQILATPRISQKRIWLTEHLRDRACSRL